MLQASVGFSYLALDVFCFFIIFERFDFLMGLIVSFLRILLLNEYLFITFAPPTGFDDLMSTPVPLWIWIINKMNVD